MSPVTKSGGDGLADGRVRATLAIAATVTLFGAYSVYLGQDANWDQLNYHVYNVYALLRGRLTYDLVPAGIQTFLPQLYNLPFYWLARYAPPILAGFALGAMQGTNAVLAFLLARSVIPSQARHRTLLATVAAAVGAWSPAAMSELGTSFGDNVVSLFVLGSLLALTRSPGALARRRSVALSGVLAGLAAGLKYTNAIYATALVGAVAWLTIRRRVPRATVPHLVAGMVVGVVAADGAWAWQLWRLYGNPVFPFFNGLFHSPYWVDSSFVDTRWIPSSLWEGLAYPFHFVRWQARTMERPFRDVRWAVLLLLGVACVLRAAWRHGSPEGMPPPDDRVVARALLTAFGGSAFVVWAFVFGYHRYLVPLELVSGVLVLIASMTLYRDEGARLITMIVLSACIVGAVRVPDWGRLRWAKTWFGVRANGYVPPHSMVLLMHTAPLSYAIPFLPHRIRFVKVELWGEAQGFGPMLANDISTAVRSHPGPLRLLGKGEITSHDRTTLARYGLEPTGRCIAVRSRLDPDLVLCALRRTTTADPTTS